MCAPRSHSYRHRSQRRGCHVHSILQQQQQHVKQQGFTMRVSTNEQNSLSRIYTNTHTYICIHAYRHVHAYAYMLQQGATRRRHLPIQLALSTHIHTCTHMHTHAHIYTCSDKAQPLRINNKQSLQVYTEIHTIHTYTHMHTSWNKAHLFASKQHLPYTHTYTHTRARAHTHTSSNQAHVFASHPLSSLYYQSLLLVFTTNSL